MCKWFNGTCECPYTNNNVCEMSDCEYLEEEKQSKKEKLELERRQLIEYINRLIYQLNQNKKYR